MRAEQIKFNFSNNIKSLRTKSRLTQVQLGEKLGYSDKTISKWENGDVMPDVATLDHIAGYFGITVNDLIEGKTSVDVQKQKRHWLIVAGVFFGIMAIATITYVILNLVFNLEKAWLSFLFAPTVFFIALIALSAVFFKFKEVTISISLLSWSIIIALFFCLLDKNIWILFLLGAILQVFYILIFFAIKNRRIKDSKQDSLELENIIEK